MWDMERISIPALAQKIQTEADAYEFMERLRWGAERENLTCPHCGNEKAYFLQPKTGDVRKTRTGSLSERRVWKCAKCRKQFSVLTGTIFHGTKVPLRTWLMVVFQMCASKNGISSREVERTYHLTPKTAWFVLHRIREAMKDDGLTMFRGVVVADETFIGGSFKNMHKSKRPDRKAGPEGGAAHKIPVLTLIDQDSGQARSRVLPRVTATTLRKAIAEQADLPSTTLYTDGNTSYNEVGREVAAHHVVDHNADEYVRYVDGAVITSNACEGFFSQLKRSLDGTHHHVSTQHLPRYLAEFDFRHSTRKMTDTARMFTLMGRVEGRRLAYRPLAGG
jgi:transposase-like protein